jgi:transcriptional regulator with XRE-family HTH domain
MPAHEQALQTTSSFTSDDSRRLTQRVAELRQARGWKQRELSHRSGIPSDRLSRLERGAPMRIDELVALARTFGLGVDELLFGPVVARDDDLERLVREIRQAVPAARLPALVEAMRALSAGFRTIWGA